MLFFLFVNQRLLISDCLQADDWHF